MSLPSIRRLTLPLLAVALLLSQWAFLVPEDGGWADIDVINGDGRGYYDYVTSIFIDHDLTDQPVNGRYIMDVDGRGVNKYFSGTGLLMLPFFLIGYLIALLAGLPIDGLSPPFQWAMCLSALSYTVIGVFFLRRTLRSFQVSETMIQVLSVTVIFGTNLLYYAALDLTASHVYSFAAVSGCSYYVRTYFLHTKVQDALIAALLLGVVILIRPVNGLIVLFIPFLAGDRETFVRALRAKTILFGAVAALIVASIQLLFYKLQSDEWFLWSYANEGFYFTQPALGNFLVGFKRGWMIYTPFFFMLVPTLVSMWRRARFQFWFTSIFLLVMVYTLSAWWSWHYGGSYGSRPMVDVYGLLLLTIGIGWDQLNFKRRKATIIGVSLVCIALTMMQVHQMRAGILSAWHMNFDKYIWSLGKLEEQRHADRLGGRDDTKPYHRQEDIFYEGGPSSSDGHWNAGKTEGAGNTVFDQDVEFGLGFTYEFGDVGDQNIFVEMDLERIERSKGAATDAFVVIELKDENDSTKLYDAFRINDRPGLPMEEWNEWHYAYSIERDVDQGDLLKIYLWNKGKGRFLVRNARLRLTALN